MGIDGRELRLARLMGDGHAVVIAIDQGIFEGPLPGMESLPSTAEQINPAVDAVLLSPGMIRHCHTVFSRPKRPLCMVRLNGATAGHDRRPRTATLRNPSDAMRAGADVALVSLSLHSCGESRAAVDIEAFSHLVADCHRLGLPVVGEYLPVVSDGATPDELEADVLLGARVAVELGVDAVRTLFTASFRSVASSCPVPVFATDAEKLPSQEESLKLAARAVAAGAGGVVFGHNTIQVSAPFVFQAALCDVVKNNVPVEQAMRTYHLECEVGVGT